MSDISEGPLHPDLFADNARLTAERDAALARLDAVRNLLATTGDHGGYCSTWGTVAVYGGEVCVCDCVLSRIKAALDPTEPTQTKDT